ncbi:TraR/DksA C4-type zinc finger protein [Patescibacteria group bacterium]|nr:TraR/DksA C4-type zinc finger protein [Patescibacteria group bacterium]
MVLLRFGPILIYHYNITLVIGFILGLFVIYRLAREEDYNVEKVLDWMLWGMLLSVIVVLGGAWILHFLFQTFEHQLSVISYQLPARLIANYELRLPAGKAGITVCAWLRSFWLVLTAYGLRIELGVLVFIIYSSRLFKRWRWKMFPPLDFTAVGAMFFYLIAAVSLSWENYFSSFVSTRSAIPVWLINFLYFSLVFYLLNLVLKRSYRGRRVLALAFVFTMRPILMLTGIVWLFMIEWFWLKKWFVYLTVGVWTKAKHLREIMLSKKKRGKVTLEELEQEKDELEGRLGVLEKEQDPRSRPERVSENAPEEDADEAEGGARFAALKTMFAQRLKDVRTALKKLKGGSYGGCDRCGAEIDPARLKAKPDARYCMACAKELEDAGRA